MTTRILHLLIAAVVCAAAGLYVWTELQMGAAGFPIDDAWIHAQFARNLAATGTMSFNAGEPSTASTAPLWTWLWAVPIALGAGPVVSGKLLGLMFAMITAGAVFELTRAISRSVAAAVIAALAVALSPRLTWGAVSGMEIPLYTALTALTLLAFVRADGTRGLVWGALAGLLTLARPEAGVLFPILVGVRWLQRPAGSARTDIISASLAFGLLVGGDVVLNLWISGRPLPSTFYAKTEGLGLFNALARMDLTEAGRSIAGRPFASLNQIARYAAEQSLILLLFALPGLLVLTGALNEADGEADPPSGSRALPALLIAGPLVVGAVAPVSPLLMQEGRYVSHLLMAFFVVSACGAAAMARRTRYPSIVWGLAVLAVLRLASQDISFARRYALQVDNINQMHVAMGRWIAQHTEPGALVATNDIGAIAFFSHRRILDLEGLATPAIVPFKAGRRHLEYLEAARPDLLVIFDEWYPHLAARTDLFRERYRLTVPRITAAHDTLKVYETPWSRHVVTQDPGAVAARSATRR